MKKANKINFNIFIGVFSILFLGTGLLYSEEVRRIEKPQKNPQSVLSQMHRKLIPVKKYTQGLVKDSIQTTSFSMFDRLHDDKLKATSEDGYDLIQGQFIGLLRKNFEDDLKFNVATFFLGNNNNFLQSYKHKKSNKNSSLFLSHFKPKLGLSKNSIKIGAEKVFLNGIQSYTSFNSKDAKFETGFKKSLDSDVYLNLKAFKEFSDNKESEVQLGIHFKF